MHLQSPFRAPRLRRGFARAGAHPAFPSRSQQPRVPPLNLNPAAALAQAQSAACRRAPPGTPPVPAQLLQKDPLQELPRFRIPLNAVPILRLLRSPAAIDGN